MCWHFCHIFFLEFVEFLGLVFLVEGSCALPAAADVGGEVTVFPEPLSEELHGDRVGLVAAAQRERKFLLEFLFDESDVVVSGDFGDDGGGADDGEEAVTFVFGDDRWFVGEVLEDVCAEALFVDVRGVDVADVGVEGGNDLAEGVRLDFVEGHDLAEVVDVRGRDDDDLGACGELVDLYCELFAAFRGALFGVAYADVFEGLVRGDEDAGDDEGAEEWAASAFVDAADHRVTGKVAWWW